MEQNRPLQDCYFFYYSKCTKGEHCGFRHEPSALGCETVCELWREGKCANPQCHLRHMELKKNRKNIPCYWETQPIGCRKPHCPFMHKLPRDGAQMVLVEGGEQPQVPRPDVQPQQQQMPEPMMVLNLF